MSHSHGIQLKKAALRPAMAAAGIELMSTLHKRMGVSRSCLDRIVLHEKSPGPLFIGSLLSALDAKFEDLFEVVPR